MPNFVYFHVYAPITGTITGLDSYCGGGYHPTRSGYSSPRDIAGTGSLVFYGSTNVKSIRVTALYNSICAGYPAPWSNGVKVDLYSALNGGGYVGTVYYGHCANPSNAGLQNARIWTIGSVPTTCPNNNCNNTCFTGAHSHMEKRASYIAEAMPLTCGQTVYAGSTVIYRWQVLI